MPTTYTFIASTTLGSAASSVSFSSIPATYKDLVLQISARSSDTSLQDVAMVEFNGNANTIYSTLLAYASGGGSGTLINRLATKSRTGYYINGAASAANTFGTVEIYVPSYAASQDKQYAAFGAYENTSSVERIGITANLFRSNVAVSSIVLTPLTGPNFLANSSFYLYGIKNS